MSRVIGIDLGTTNCCVAVHDGEQVRVLSNRGGYKTTPSVVAIAADGRTVVGQPAQRQAVTNAKNTAYAIKRLMGRPFQAEEVQHARAHVAYAIVAGPGGDPRIVLHGRDYSCPEISAILLSEMRAIAEHALGETVEKAVITVPAYFNDSQRQSVRDAGRIAGLDVLRIVNEPTAAAVAYGAGRERDRTVVVYDLGGGTFDVSIVRCTGGSDFKVLATTGDSFLGGEDFDERIMGWLLDGFEAEHEISVRTQPLVLQRVREASAKAKCDLSAVPRTEVQLPFLTVGKNGPLSMHYEVTREILDALTGDLVERTIAICQHALESIRMPPSAIDEVVLVGGMTRMPLVQERVAALFGRPASKGVHPDEAVAIGAALHGAALVDQVDDISLEDVTSQPIGLAAAGDRFVPIIPANTPVPCKVARKFSTTRDEQTAVKVKVLQGDSTKASENELLHEFEITGLRKARAGQVTLEVAFAIDAEGMFHVTATDLGTGQATMVRIVGDGGLREEEIEQLAARHRSAAEERRSLDALESMRQVVETLVSDLRRLLDRASAAGLAGRAEVREARALAESLGAGIASYDRSDLAELLPALEAAAAELRAVIG